MLHEYTKSELAATQTGLQADLAARRAAGVKHQNLGARGGFPFGGANPAALIYSRPGRLVPSEKELITAVFEMVNKIFAEELFLPVALPRVFVCPGEP